MKEVENIDKVVFSKIEDDPSIPNVIATFYVKESSALHHMRQSAVKIIQYVAELIDPQFDLSLNMENRWAIQKSAWVVMGEDYEDTPAKVTFIHRTWDMDDIEIFREIIRLLAYLHSWKIEE